MNIFEILVVIAGLGLGVWILTQLPMPPVFKNVIIAVASFVLVVWVLQHLGLIGGFRGLR